MSTPHLSLRGHILLNVIPEKKNNCHLPNGDRTSDSFKYTGRQCSLLETCFHTVYIIIVNICAEGWVHVHVDNNLILLYSVAGKIFCYAKS